MNDDESPVAEQFPGFCIGDVVRLNSGGMAMTVIDSMNDDPAFIHVEWMVAGIIQRHAFSPSCLYKSERT